MAEEKGKMFKKLIESKEKEESEFCEFVSQKCNGVCPNGVCSISQVIICDNPKREESSIEKTHPSLKGKECDCKNRKVIEKNHPYRQEILDISESDRKHQINSMGKLSEQNAYGEIVSQCQDCGKELPIICMHGGSMWLCRPCKELFLLEEHTLDKEVVRDVLLKIAKKERNDLSAGRPGRFLNEPTYCWEALKELNIK